MTRRRTKYGIAQLLIVTSLLMLLLLGQVSRIGILPGTLRWDTLALVEEPHRAEGQNPYMLTWIQAIKE